MSVVTIAVDKNARSAIGMNDGSLVIAYTETSSDAPSQPDASERGRLVLRQYNFFGVLKKEVVLEDFISDDVKSDSADTGQESGISWVDLTVLNDGNVMVLYSTYAEIFLNAPPRDDELIVSLKAKIFSPLLEELNTIVIRSDVYVDSSITSIQYESYGRFRAEQLTGGNIIIPHLTIDVTTSRTNDTGRYVVYNSDLSTVVKTDATLINPASGRIEAHAFSDGIGALLYSEQDLSSPVFPKISFIDSSGDISSTITADTSSVEGANQTGERGPSGSITTNDTLFIITNDTDSVAEVTTFVEYNSSGSKITGPTVINGLSFVILMAFSILTLLDNGDIAAAYIDADTLEPTYILINKTGSTWQWAEQIVPVSGDDGGYVITAGMPFNADATFPPLRSDVGSKFGVAWSDGGFGPSGGNEQSATLKFEITGTELAGADLIGSGLDFGSLAGGGGRYNSKLIAVGHQAIYVEDI